MSGVQSDFAVVHRGNAIVGGEFIAFADRKGTRRDIEGPRYLALRERMLAARQLTVACADDWVRSQFAVEIMADGTLILSRSGYLYGAERNNLWLLTLSLALSAVCGGCVFELNLRAPKR